MKDDRTKSSTTSTCHSHTCGATTQSLRNSPVTAEAILPAYQGLAPKAGRDNLAAGSELKDDPCGYPSGQDIVDGLVYFVDFPVYRDDLGAPSRM